MPRTMAIITSATFSRCNGSVYNTHSLARERERERERDSWCYISNTAVVPSVLLATAGEYNSKLTTVQ